MAAEIVRIAKEHDCFLILADYREANLKLSTTEIYEALKQALNIAASAALRIEKFKWALVVRNDLTDIRR